MLKNEGSKGITRKKSGSGAERKNAGSAGRRDRKNRSVAKRGRARQRRTSSRFNRSPFGHSQPTVIHEPEDHASQEANPYGPKYSHLPQRWQALDRREILCSRVQMLAAAALPRHKQHYASACIDRGLARRVSGEMCIAVGEAQRNPRIPIVKARL
jgi:hypothetical protein